MKGRWEREGRTAKESEENEEERGERRKREVEKAENKKERVRRRCEIWRESCGGLSWGICWRSLRTCLIFEPDIRMEVPVVPDVIDVLVSPSSLVAEFCNGLSRCSDWDFVEPQSFSFSKKRAHCCTSTWEEMRYESTQVKAPPLSRRRMRPPTPLQNSNSCL